MLAICAIQTRSRLGDNCIPVNLFLKLLGVLLIGQRGSENVRACILKMLGIFNYARETADCHYLFLSDNQIFRWLREK